MYYVLNESDKQAIQELLADKRNRRNPLRTQHPGETSQSPEVYIARTPYAGIPALALEPGTASGQENDQPGYADCTIYQILNEGSVPSLEQTGAIPKRVYNLSESSLPGDTWVVAVRDKFGSWFALTPVGGFTGCKAIFDACTNERDYLWYVNGLLTNRNDPCPGCEEPPETTGTGTGTEYVEFVCEGFDAIEVPTELCLRMSTASGTVGDTGVPGETCITTYNRTVKLILSPDSIATGFSPYLEYYGEVSAPEGSAEHGDDSHPWHKCQAWFRLELYCDKMQLFGAIVRRTPNAGGIANEWEMVELAPPGFGYGPIYAPMSLDPADWGANTELVFIGGLGRVAEIFTITPGPCHPCPNPPFVKYNNYSITGTTPFVIIEGTFPDATVGNTDVIFNLGAEGVVVEVNADRTRLTVLFTIRPTSTGPLTAIVVVDGCCNNAPGNPAELPDEEEPGTGTGEEGGLDILVPLVIATPFDIGGV